MRYVHEPIIMPLGERRPEIIHQLEKKCYPSLYIACVLGKMPKNITNYRIKSEIMEDYKRPLFCPFQSSPRHSTGFDLKMNCTPKSHMEDLDQLTLGIYPFTLMVNHLVPTVWGVLYTLNQCSPRRSTDLRQPQSAQAARLYAAILTFFNYFQNVYIYSQTFPKKVYIYSRLVKKTVLTSHFKKMIHIYICAIVSSLKRGCTQIYYTYIIQVYY